MDEVTERKDMYDIDMYAVQRKTDALSVYLPEYECSFHNSVRNREYTKRLYEYLVMLTERLAILEVEVEGRKQKSKTVPDDVTRIEKLEIAVELINQSTIPKVQNDIDMHYEDTSKKFAEYDQIWGPRHGKAYRALLALANPEGYFLKNYEADMEIPDCTGMQIDGKHGYRCLRVDKPLQTQDGNHKKAHWGYL